MQPTLVFLFCLIGTVLSLYQDKTRFDRSVSPELTEETEYKKDWSFTDDETYFKAHKDRHENNCYLENLKDDRVGNPRNPKLTNVLYAPTQALTKIEAWRIAGGRIVEFCVGRSIILLQDTVPISDTVDDPFYNQLPIDENDIVTKRVADVLLTPLLSRAKRQVILEEREKLNQEVALNRRRRQAPQFRGRFRGQTQSQYLSTDGNNEKDGKAEAEATHQSSRAVVSGSRGMGQAQSMSMGGSGCEDCPGTTGYLHGEGVPDRLRTQEVLRGDGRYTFPPGMPVPGTPAMVPSTGGTYYPTMSETGVRTSQGKPGLPGTVGSGTIQSQPDMIPSGLTRPGTIPGTIPGTTGQGQGPTNAGRGGTIYPGVQLGSDFPPQTYPGRQPGETLVYPGGTAPGVMPGSATYPGGVSPGSQVRGSEIHPGMPHSTSGNGLAPGSGTYTQEMGGITPGSKISYPGGVMPSQDRRYPSGTGPGTQMTYPGGMTSGGGLQYPGAMGPNTGSMYPGGVLPDSGSMHYGNVQPGMTRPVNLVDTFQSTRGDDKTSTYPEGMQPGRTGPGTGIMYPERQSTGTNIMPGRENVGYPGVYQPGTIGPGSNVPGTMIPGGKPSYPSSISTDTIQSGGTGTYPGALPTGSMPDSGIPRGTLPGGNGHTGTGGIAPSGTVPGGIYPTGAMTGPSPGMYDGRPQPGGVMQQYYPPSTVPGTVPLGTGNGGTGTGTIPTYPGGMQPGTIGTYPGNLYPGRTGPVGGPSDAGTLLNYPTGVMPNVGQTTQLGTHTQTGVDQGQQIGVDQGRRMYPGNIGGDTRGPQVPHSVQGGAQVPHYDSTVMQGGPDNTYSGSPGTKHTPQYPTQPGTYPSGTLGVPGSMYLTDRNGNVQMTDAERQRLAQYPTATGNLQGQGIGVNQYPSSQHPGGFGVPGATDQISPYYKQQEQEGTLPSREGDDASADSQASSSVKQVDAGTQASASAQGGYGKGTAQSQVMGTYSGSGSFQAQAGTSDVNKSAQTEISGGKEGATSVAQGVGGYGKSQVQVQLDSESGATSTDAQSSGWNHGTNSQVQASSKGGMADAQANGEGSTSSQAQIGFRPYLKTNENLESRQSKPFRGGGSASAQSGTYRGQSQSQLEGSFQYGITYTGAAQAGSGSGAAASRKPFNFNLTDTDIFKTFKPYNPVLISKDVESETTTEKPITNFERNQDDLQASSTSQKVSASNQGKMNPQNPNHKKPQTSGKPRMDENMYDTNADYEDEYDEEYYDPPPAQGSTNSKISAAPVREQQNNPDQQQSQMMHINTNKRYGVRVRQDSTDSQEDHVLQPGESLPGYTVPTGFRGRVTSISGKETLAHGDGNSQSQTFTLVPTGSNSARETKSPITETRSLQTTHEKLEQHLRKEKHLGTARNQVSHVDQSKAGDVPISPSYYTVTNSVAGKMDDRSAPRKYEHRYYTKSSTCGYFTFSCNIVYGSNGRTKICKPKVPTYPDGTPMKC